MVQLLDKKLSIAIERYNDLLIFFSFKFVFNVKGIEDITSQVDKCHYGLLFYFGVYCHKYNLRLELRCRISFHTILNRWQNPTTKIVSYIIGFMRQGRVWKWGQQFICEFFKESSTLICKRLDNTVLRIWKQMAQQIYNHLVFFFLNKSKRQNELIRV